MSTINKYRVQALHPDMPCPKEIEANNHDCAAEIYGEWFFSKIMLKSDIRVHVSDYDTEVNQDQGMVSARGKIFEVTADSIDVATTAKDVSNQYSLEDLQIISLIR